MTTPLDIHVTRRFQQEIDQYRRRLGALATRAWSELDGYDDRNVAELVAAMATGEAATRRAVAHLTAGYVQLITDETITLDPAALPSTAELWRQPFLTTWGQLARGTPRPAAIAAGAGRARSTGGQVVSHLARASAASIDDSTSVVTGWRRVPSGACCQWCVDVSADIYGSAEAAALGDQHANCSCDVVPVTDEKDPGAAVNADRQTAPADARYVAPDGTPVETA